LPAPSDWVAICPVDKFSAAVFRRLAREGELDQPFYGCKGEIFPLSVRLTGLPAWLQHAKGGYEKNAEALFNTQGICIISLRLAYKPLSGAA